jgi:PqqD family protein of HPr-rel-A system
MRYHADPASLLRVVKLDILTAIYHRRSGQTHLVGEPVPEILDALGQGGADLSELLKRLDLPDNSDNREALSDRLAEMLTTGLVYTS